MTKESSQLSLATAEEEDARAARFPTPKTLTSELERPHRGLMLREQQFGLGAGCHAVQWRSALSSFRLPSVGMDEECRAFPLSAGPACIPLPYAALLSLRTPHPSRQVIRLH
ncbi:hypothetical protein SRHO_G00209040 [Serrasalmus rhombeus]